MQQGVVFAVTDKVAAAVVDVVAVERAVPFLVRLERAGAVAAFAASKCGIVVVGLLVCLLASAVAVVSCGLGGVALIAHQAACFVKKLRALE